MSPDDHADQLFRTRSAPRQSPWVRRLLAKGPVLQTTLLVGHPHGVAALHQRLLEQPRHHYRVIGCCVPTPGRAGETLDGLPVLGGRDDVVDVVRSHHVDTVAVLLSSGWDGAALSRLERDLEPTRADLLLAPSGTAVGRRSLPHRERPGLHRVHGLVKASFDRITAALLILLLAPVLLGVAVCVKVSGRGPVFSREPRAGRDGRLFHLLKFRSTELGTRLGSTLRRYAIDELPALFNVVKGDMSLVGPRPGLHSGSTRPGGDLDRRLHVKPGLIGLRPVLRATCAAVLRRDRAP